MKKYLYFFLLICSVQLSNAQTPLDTAQPKFIFKSLYNYAIQEDVKTILAILDTLPSYRLAETDLPVKEKYYSRFVSGNEIFDYNTEDQLIKDVFDIYRVYWTSVLLKHKSLESADSILLIDLSDYLVKNYSDENNWDKTDIANEPFKYFSKLLTTNGYFNNVDGKTGNLYDIYIWKTQDTVNYDVELTDGNISVPVLFMKDLITLGWEEYATFGNAYPGGWPKDSVLYCVAKAYDTAKENFKVSYLVHEAQHFSDIKKYNEIPSWKLEYRAKLAELTKADENLYKLLAYFTRGSKDDSTLSHPYGQYCVIRDLSGKIFNESFINDSEIWRSINADSIHKASEELLILDSSKLILKE